MPEEAQQQLTNPETARRWKHTGNWNRKIHIPGVWAGMVQNIPPHAVEALIAQGRTDFVPITDQAAAKPAKPASQVIKEGESPKEK